MKTLSAMQSTCEKHLIEFVREGTEYYVVHWEEGQTHPTVLHKFKQVAPIGKKNAEFKLARFVESISDPKVIEFRRVNVDV